MVPNCIWSILFFIVPFSLPMSKLFCKLKIFYKFKAHQYNWRQAGLMRAEGEFIMQMTWGWFFPVEGRNVSRKQHYPQGCVHQRYRKLRWTERAVSKVSPSAPALMWLELYHRCCQESGADQEFYCLGILWGGGQDLGPEWLHLPPSPETPSSWSPTVQIIFVFSAFHRQLKHQELGTEILYQHDLNLSLISTEV